ncbi:MAG: hypothetical protein ACTTJW_08350, partial [Sphaerochaeta sp.]
SGLSGALQTINQNVINDKNAVDEFARANHIDVLAINKSLTDVKNSVVSQSPIAGLTDVKDAVNTMSSGLSGALQIINQNVINDKNAINQLSAANHADLVALLTAFNVLSQDLKKKFEMIINGFIRVGAFAKHIDLLSEGSSFSLSGLERFVTYSIRFRSFSLIVPSDVKIFVVSTNVDSSYSVGQLVGNIYTGVTLNATSWQGTYDDITIVINLI